MDTDQPEYCDPEALIQFLLALCCQDDASTTPISRDESLEKLFEDCFEKVIPVANSHELRKRLDDYKKSVSTYTWDRCFPFAEALNHALEHLSDIQINGLPEFKTHIAFVPCNEEPPFDRDSSGSSLEPDILLMSIQDARKFYELDQLDTPTVSQFISEIAGKSHCDFTSWKAVLSAVAIEWDGGISGWASLEVSSQQDRKVGPIRDVSQRIDEKVDDSRHTTPVPSETLASSKRSASTAEMKVSAETSASKRQRMQKNSTKTVTQALAVQNDIYTAEKFSNSFCISHVLNLMIENDCVWISWIDREGAIFSSGFSFFENLPLILVLLLVLQRFGRRQWGYIPELTAEDHSILLHPINPDGTLGEDEVDINFYPEDMIHSSSTLFGRATTVIGASRNEKENSGTTEGEPAKVHGGVDGVASRKVLS